MSAPASPPRSALLKRTMGLWMATALVVGNMIGSGVFLLPASMADVAGPISILGWLFTGAGAILLAYVFANLGRAYPRTGGPYAYSRKAFGDFAGFWTAWGYWIAAWAGNAAITVAFVGYAAVFWRSEEHTSELQSRQYLVCRLLLDKKITHSPYPSNSLSLIPDSLLSDVAS